MRYDRDLKWIRRGAWCLFLLNLALVWISTFTYRHSWLTAAASLIWLANCAMWLRVLGREQAWRDETKRRMYEEISMMEDFIREQRGDD